MELCPFHGTRFHIYFLSLKANERNSRDARQYKFVPLSVLTHTHTKGKTRHGSLTQLVSGTHLPMPPTSPQKIYHKTTIQHFDACTQEHQQLATVGQRQHKSRLRQMSKLMTFPHATVTGKSCLCALLITLVRQIFLCNCRCKTKLI